MFPIYMSEKGQVSILDSAGQSDPILRYHIPFATHLVPFSTLTRAEPLDRTAFLWTTASMSGFNSFRHDVRECGTRGRRHHRRRHGPPRLGTQRNRQLLFRLDRIPDRSHRILGEDVSGEVVEGVLRHQENIRHGQAQKGEKRPDQI